MNWTNLIWWQQIIFLLGCWQIGTIIGWMIVKIIKMLTK